MKSLFRFLIPLLLIGGGLQAHPMPNSILLLDVKEKGVKAELQWPLKELQLAFPHEQLDVDVNTLLQRKGEWLDNYLRRHMQVTDSAGHIWTLTINSKKVITTEQAYTGAFHELVFELWLQAPEGSSPRHFIMHYDAIMHQVVTHKMLIRIRQDWDGGLSTKDSLDADLGVLMMNTSDNTIPPLIVNLDEGSKWKGFKNMVSLGMEHIREGSDHLLFLLVLMLSAPLIALRGRWFKSGGMRYSLIRLLKIATAFTVGHSITLLAGAAGWLRLPAQPVEILIALSILIGAAHALRPLFPGREVLIAGGFGLIHGLAFASALAGLDLDGTRMSLSILGFNTGIELMQLFIILLFAPWLILLSRYYVYSLIRIIGGLFGVVASIAWIVERIAGKANVIGTAVQTIAMQGQWIVLALALLSLIAYFMYGKKQPLR